MAYREAACSCGQLRLEVEGDPGRTPDAIEHLRQAIDKWDDCLATWRSRTPTSIRSATSPRFRN